MTPACSQDVHRALVIVASWEGMTIFSPDINVRIAQAELLLPDDALAPAMAYLRSRTLHGSYVSTCALLVGAYFRLLGIQHDRLSRPYLSQTGEAMANVERIARSEGLFRDSPTDLATYPEPGHVVRLDNAARTNAHVLIVQGTDAATGDLLSTDGGQVDSTVTARRERKMIVQGEKSYLVNPDTPYRSDGSPNGREITARIVTL